MNPYDKIDKDKKCNCTPNCTPIIIGMTGPTGPQGERREVGPKGDTTVSSSEGSPLC